MQLPRAGLQGPWRRIIASSHRTYSHPPTLAHASRVLSLGYLHFCYAWLLVFPRTLSAEYSFNCIPAVASLLDPRNLFTIGAYASLGLAAACGFGVVDHRAALAACFAKIAPGSGAQTRGGSGGGRAHGARGGPSASSPVDGRLLEALAWGSFPFVPASAVFTRVGTLLAERLLYLPSLGYCLLVGWAIDAAEAAVDGFDGEGAANAGTASAADCASAGETRGAATSAATPGAAVAAVASAVGAGSSSRGGDRRPLRGLRQLCWALVAALAARTRTRIPAWQDDWSLFHATAAACPASAKTQNQLSQLEMNRGDAAASLRRSLRAKELDPDFCDADYSAALAYAKLGDIAKARPLLNASLYCTFTATGAFENLQRVWRHLLALPGGASDGALLEDIGDVLAGVARGAALQRAADAARAKAKREHRGSLWGRWLGSSGSDGGSGGGSSGDEDEDDGGGGDGAPMLDNALEHYQSAGAAHVNGHRNREAQAVLNKALRLWHHRGHHVDDRDGDKANGKASGKASGKGAERPPDKRHCELRYWLARAALGLANDAAAGGGGGRPKAFKKHAAMARAHAAVAADPSACPSSAGPSKQLKELAEALG